MLHWPIQNAVRPQPPTDPGAGGLHEQFAQGISSGLQAVENWTSANDKIFYGRDGVLTGADREHAGCPCSPYRSPPTSRLIVFLRDGQPEPEAGAGLLPGGPG
jgi:hypothetical protein